MAGWPASKDQLPVERLGDYEGRLQQIGDYYAIFENIPAGLGGPQMFKGLPDDACQCEHWGYLFKGRFMFTYTDGS